MGGMCVTKKGTLPSGQIPEPGRGREGRSPRASRGNAALRPLEQRETVSVVVSPQVCGGGFRSLRKRTQAVTLHFPPTRSSQHFVPSCLQRRKEKHKEAK